MRLFHTYLFVLGIRSVYVSSIPFSWPFATSLSRRTFHRRDTQCGFKLSTRASAAHIYPSLHSPSWIFDCELLLLASLSGIPLREVGIQWHEVDGSKVDLIKDSVGMAVDLLVIRGNYWMGRWAKPGWVNVSLAEVKEGEKEKKKSR